MWRTHTVEQSEAREGRWELLGGGAASSLPSAAAAAAARFALPPSILPVLCFAAGGKRSTAGFKKRAGEISLSVLAQSLLGKPLDKSCHVGGVCGGGVRRWSTV